MKVSTIKINKICRICFRETKDLTSFSNNQGEVKYPGLIQKIRECGGIELRKEIGLPILICNDCIENTKIAYKFRLQCQHSEARLRLLHEELIQQYIRLSESQKNLPETFNLPAGTENSRQLIIDEEISNEGSNCYESSSSQVIKAYENKKKVDGSLSSDQFQQSESGETPSKRKYKRKKIQCQHCFETFISHETLAHHLFNNHGEKYKCLWCPDTFDTLKLMKSHKNTHDFQTRRRQRNYSLCSNESISLKEGNDDKKCSYDQEKINNNLSQVKEKNDDKRNLPESGEKLIDKKDDQTCAGRSDDQDYAGSNSAAGGKLIASKCSQSGLKENKESIASTSHGKIIDKSEKMKFKKVRIRKMRLRNFILHKCEICRRTFESIGALNQHKRNHISRHICNLCNRAFLNQKMLDKHQKVDHSADKDEVDESRVCYFCNKIFVSSNRRFKHEKKVHWELEV